MNWILLATGVIVSSISYYLSIRKSRNIGSNLDHQFIAMFFLPTVFIGLFNVVSGKSFNLSLENFLIILGMTVVFSWFGNRFSLIGLTRAPNQGYSLVISKGYVIMTSFLAVWLFNSPLPLKSIIAIILVVGFTSLILIERSKKIQKSNKDWVFPSILAFFAYGFQALLHKHLISTGVDPLVLIFYQLLLLLIFTLFDILKSKRKIEFGKSRIFWIVIVSIAYTFFNVFLLTGYKYAPNPGFISAANVSSVALVTLFSAWIFKDEFNVRKLIGVIGVVGSLILLFI